HVIDRSGVHVDPAKIEAINSWAAPMTPTEKYEWGKEKEESFQTLKQKLCSAPILALPDGTKDFVAYCDASLKGYGAELMQKEKIREAREEAMIGENVKAENLRRLIKPIFEFYPDGTRCFENHDKENQEKDKIRSKPDKNGKRGEAGKSQKPLQLKEEEKPKKTKKEWPKTHARIKSYKLLNKEEKKRAKCAFPPNYNHRDQSCQVPHTCIAKDEPCNNNIHLGGLNLLKP
nr:putative reverse transcriptase domain-containing protein [Tanacetum cinerariifolium]